MGENSSPLSSSFNDFSAAARTVTREATHSSLRFITKGTFTLVCDMAWAFSSEAISSSAVPVAAELLGPVFQETTLKVTAQRSASISSRLRSVFVASDLLMLQKANNGIYDRCINVQLDQKSNLGCGAISRVGGRVSDKLIRQAIANRSQISPAEGK
jgi:hypothetical protein